MHGEFKTSVNYSEILSQKENFEIVTVTDIAIYPQINECASPKSKEAFPHNWNVIINLLLIFNPVSLFLQNTFYKFVVE